MIPWTRGSEHAHGWILLMTWLAIGLLCNVVQMGWQVRVFLRRRRAARRSQLMRPPTSVRDEQVGHWTTEWNADKSSELINFILAIENALFDLICLCQCAANFSARAFVGSSPMCLFQGVYALFLMSASGWSTVLIVYHLFCIVLARPLTLLRVLQLQAVIWAAAAVTAVLAAVRPGRTQLNPSGLFCFGEFHAEAGLIILLAFVLPVLLSLVVLYVKISRGLAHMDRERHRLNSEVQPRHAQRRSLKLLSMYPALMLLCYLPMLVLLCWEMAHQTAGSPALYQWMGLFGHADTTINPMLYALVWYWRRRDRIHNSQWARSLQEQFASLSLISSLELLLQVAYPELLAESQKNFCAENILALQAISDFKHKTRRRRSVTVTTLKTECKDDEPEVSVMGSVQSCVMTSLNGDSKQDSARADALDIYERFLAPNAPWQVNVSFEQVRGVELALEKPDSPLSTLFDEVEGELQQIVVTTAAFAVVRDRQHENLSAAFTDMSPSVELTSLEARISAMGLPGKESAESSLAT